MFRTKANFLIGIFFILPFFCHAQNWKTLLQAKGPSTVLTKGVEMAPQGELYWIGIFEEYVVFGSDTLFSAGSSDAFLCKYEASGKLKWSLRFGGTALDRVLSTAVDKSGNVYLTGGFSDQIIFGNDTLFSDSRDIFVVKYNNNGQVLWAQSMKGNLSDFGQGIEVNAQEQVFLTGIFMSDSLKIGSTTLYKRGNSDMFLVKLDNNGQLIWAQQGGAVSTTLGNAVALDTLNNIYVTGSFQDSASFSGNWLHSQGRSDAFLACYQPSGSLKWVQPISGPGFDAGQALAGTEDGVLITGRFSDVLSLDTFILPHRGNYDIFMAAYDANGSTRWAKAIGGTSKDGSYGLDYQKGQGIYLTGEYSDEVLFDQDSLRSKGLTDAFLAKYDLQGHLRWVLSAGGLSLEQAYAAFATRNQEIYFAGHFRAMAMFDTLILNSGGRDDAFLAKIIDRDTLPPPPPINILPLSGKIFEDNNTDCRADSQELGFARWFVLAEPGPYFGLSDQAGDFSMELPPNSYRLRNLMPRDISSWLYSRCAPVQYATIGGGTTQNFRALAFGQAEKAEVQLQLSVDGDDFVACQRGIMFLQYANTGADIAKSLSIQLHLPEQISLLQADLPFSSQGAGNYLFLPGDLMPQQEGRITLQFGVSCNQSDIIGQNLRLIAEIHSSSERDRKDPRWNGAELTAYGSCMGGDSSLFVIKNAGSADLADSVSIRFYADDVLCKEARIWLSAGDSLGYLVHSLGQAIRLEVQQAAFHPRERWFSQQIEACQADPSLPLSLGYAQHFSQYDPEASYIFQVNRPLVSGTQKLKWEILPVGRGSQHYIHSDERLYFHLGYHATNTLHQLAFVDTLPEWLDPASMRWETRSHDFDLSVDGKGSPVLHFSLSHDSLAAGEYSFVSFSLMLKAAVPEGMQMRQRAWIKADTAAWQPTSWLYHSLGAGSAEPDCERVKAFSFEKPVTTDISKTLLASDILIQPNPCDAYLQILFASPPQQLGIQLFDLSGKQIRVLYPENKSRPQLDMTGLPAGLYFVHIQSDNITEIHKVIKR